METGFEPICFQSLSFFDICLESFSNSTEWVEKAKYEESEFLETEWFTQINSADRDNKPRSSDSAFKFRIPPSILNNRFPQSKLCPCSTARTHTILGSLWYFFPHLIWGTKLLNITKLTNQPNKRIPSRNEQIQVYGMTQKLRQQRWFTCTW